jgi:hypoxanthine-DNA glycosylase
LDPVYSFPPIAGPDARVLVLGSMPGAASLRAGEYYAHPRNAFWGILGAYCGFPRDLPYAARAQRLVENGIAVWDVLQSCERAGGLDAAIVGATERPNDLPGFFARQPRLVGVLCNGTKAWTAFRSFVVPALGAAAGIEVVRLPSTSPAHAALRAAAKQAAWHAALARCLGR